MLDRFATGSSAAIARVELVTGVVLCAHHTRVEIVADRRFEVDDSVELLLLRRFIR